MPLLPRDTVGALRVGPEILAEGAPGGPLARTTFVAKDLFALAGHPTSYGNPDWLADAPLADANAPVVERLLGAGSTLIGRSISDEFAYSVSGTNSPYGTPVNPAAPGHIPGGSSSGSASAVASGLADIGLGTDTGGSVRVPASYCGIVGLRPTFGRVDITGVLPLAPSMDTVGWFARGGALAARVGDVLLDGEGGAPGEVLYVVEADGADLGGSVGRIADHLGLEPQPAQPGRWHDWRAAYRVLQPAEAWATIGPWVSQRRPKMVAEVAARFEHARGVTADEVAAQQPVRESASAWLPPDALVVMPTTAGSPPRLGMDDAARVGHRDRTLELTSLATFAGVPQISLPLVEVDGLPLGVSVVGPRGSDETLLGIAAALVP